MGVTLYIVNCPQCLQILELTAIQEA